MNWSQLATVIWLRWRLTCNQWSKNRSGRVAAILSIIAVVAGLCIAAAVGAGGVVGGALALAGASPRLVLVVWDAVVVGFLFIWLLGVLTEIQRSESIDLARLLHLPVSLKGVFVVNYLASHLAFSLIIFLPGMLGLCLGLLWSKGWAMILLIPLVLTFIFMVTAWTYCVRGWLVSLMVNPRRRRNVMVGIAMAAVLLGQLPNLYFNVFARRSFHPPHRAGSPPEPFTPRRTGLDALPPSYLSAHGYVPFLWLPNGAMALQTGNAWPAVWGSLGAFLLGAAGLARAYRSTIRFYQGQEKAVAAKPSKSTNPSPARGKSLLERTVPLVSEETGALALAFFRSLSRAPEIKMAMVSNVVVLVAVAVGVFSHVTTASGKVAQLFIVPGAVAVTFFGLLQIIFNQFGFERDGFRALVLLPASRRHVLLAKNLSLAPVVCFLGLALLAGLEFIARLPLVTMLTGCLQLAAMFLVLNMAGNFCSVMVPYRVAAGSMKPTKTSAMTVLMIFLTHLLFPLLMIPFFLTPALALVAENWMGWSAELVNALLSLLLLTAAFFAYRWSLVQLGNLLEDREKKILLVVSQEVE